MIFFYLFNFAPMYIVFMVFFLALLGGSLELGVELVAGMTSEVLFEELNADGSILHFIIQPKSHC